MIERELFVGSDDLLLAGTLCLPGGDGPYPVVLMVHGSGPLDRNENFKGQQLNAFNTMAHHLASRGIASLRYDKRGCGDSAGDFYSTGHAELVQDATRWVDELLVQPRCDPEQVFVLGHSEGTVIAPQVFARKPAIAGLLLLCPFVDNIESVLIKQAQQLERELAGRTSLLGRPVNTLFRLLGASAAKQQRNISTLKHSTADTIRIRFQKVPARWFRELFALDLPAIYRAVTCPVLLLGGEKDLQCDPADVARIAQLMREKHTDVTAEVVPGLTHLLRLEAGEPRLTSSRRLLRKPVEPLVLEALGLWLEQQL